MSVQMGTDLVIGGWDGIKNLFEPGTYFPAQQRETVKSETVQAAGGTGWTYRPTAPENQSMIETQQMSYKDWLGSPYEDNFSVSTKRQESKDVAKGIEPKGDPLGEGLDWAFNQTMKITTLYDQLKGLWEPREVIRETPRAGSPEGKDVRNLNDIVKKGAEVYKAGAGWVGGIYDQVKGLFNLGFDQTGKQPAFSIQHEIEPTVKVGIGVIAAVIILVLLLRK